MNSQATATADPAASPDAAPPNAPGRWSTNPRRLVLIVVATVAVIGAAVAAATWWLVPDADAASEETEEGELLTLEPMTIGLSGSGHARIGVGLVLSEGADPAELEPRLPLMKDAALERVAGMSASELSSPAGMSRLRDELARDAADIFVTDGEPVVVRAFLTELVVQ